MKVLQNVCLVFRKGHGSEAERKTFDISLIQWYAATATADNNDDEIDKFYEQLDEAIKQCRSQDIRISMGDFNAEVGGERDGRAVGPFGLVRGMKRVVG